MKNHLIKVGLAALVASAGLALSGCVSTEDFDKHVEEMNSRHAATTARLDGLDSKVNSVGQATQAAQARADAAQQRADAAQMRADAAYRLAEGKFLMTEVGREEVRFDTGKSALSAEAKGTLTALADRLKSENKNVYVLVRGHADSRGGKVANRQLGRERAANTARFLVDQGVPGNKVQIGSWGEDEAKVKGKSSEALAANRRVEVLVLS